eukprot:CAMPEP_0177491638 /NCGR_PEP_ID=MMETSP0369-20130122/31931_1 /TAXON_ID=447022 ORGANISM="Scrippsiella hangoei-like, Strain SHHI-4" /NCGR_SAMPLE_ID=MMETSP0369 /ASSEMBLY_ACC=CAM_ASM_000364 /LENGTH=274 /DNA_ID=CAMNT_0018968357 /DNA_START=104 /DNA_END=929 /DNA_ORIENTATION=-
MQGDSAGALIGVAWSLGLPADFLEEVYSDLAMCGPVEMVKLRLSDYHDAAIDRIFQKFPDAHERIRGRCQIGITVFPRKHIWVTEWRDLAHLRNCLHCSMHIPLYCREVPFWEGQAVVDGGIAIGGKHLAHGDRTLVLSAAPWSSWPGERMFDLAIPLPITQTMLPPSGDFGAQRMFELGASLVREWFENGGRMSPRKRRSAIFRVGGSAVCAGMWTLRALEQYALPSRVDDPRSSAPGFDEMPSFFDGVPDSCCTSGLRKVLEHPRAAHGCMR